MPSKIKRQISPYVEKIRKLKILLFLVCIGLFLFFVGPSIWSFLQATLAVPRFVTSVLIDKNIDLKKEDDAVNVLLLGIGGGNHDGANLTDTIILAHIDPKTNSVLLVSIPRDLWAQVLQAKINTAYEFGEEKKKGGGLTLAKATVSEILGQDVNYAFLIDFSGFVKVVDIIGGVDIDVERTLDDYNYPVPKKENDSCGKTDEEVATLIASISATPTKPSLVELFPCRVEHLHFDKGHTHMDGETALKYVRSRQAIGVEGTDFARSRRQQKVITAVREKILSLGVLLNPIKLTQIWTTIQNSIDTDIVQNEFDDFVKLAQKMKGANIKSVVLDQGDGDRIGLLINPPIADYGAWVLAPRTGNFDEIKTYVSCEILEATNSASPTDSCLPER